MLEFSTNSWHGKLYKFAYGYGNYSYPRQFPSNLCPYFWKIVLAILLMPILLITELPLLVFPESRRDVKYDGALGSNIVFGIASWLGISLIFCAITAIFIWHPVKDSLWQMVVIMGRGVLTLVVFGLTVLWITEWHTRRKRRPKNPSLLSSYIQAKKDKLCPKINWKP